jgi:hypothetical protein
MAEFAQSSGGINRNSTGCEVQIAINERAPPKAELERGTLEMKHLPISASTSQGESSLCLRSSACQ